MSMYDELRLRPACPTDPGYESLGPLGRNGALQYIYYTRVDR